MGGEKRILSDVQNNGQKKRIRLIALDLDQTTLRSDKSLSSGNREAILEAIEAGIHVVIASGRAFGSLPSQVLEIPGIEYAVTSNGSAIYRLPQGERCHEFLMEAGVIRRLAKLIPQDLAIEAFWEGRAYASSAYVEDPVRFGATERAAVYVRATRTPVEDIRKFMLAHQGELDSLQVVVGGQEPRDLLWRELKRAVPGLYLTSSAPTLLEISQTEGGKKCGLKWLGEHLGILPEEMMAFGDAQNDLDMIHYAGVGVAMGNGHPQLKEAADRVTLTNDEDGVGVVIREYLKN